MLFSERSSCEGYRAEIMALAVRQAQQTFPLLRVQALHLPQGSGVMPDSQFRHLARIRASVVLPTPRVPVKRYAWCSRCSVSAWRSAFTTCSCPTKLAKSRGRHLRARTW